MSKPNLYVIAAPSGGGKTSLINALLARDEKVRLSVSHTTRPPRPGEQDGIHYHFVDEPTFVRLIGRNAFLEHARVFGYRYGTGRAQVERQLERGFDVLLDIDWQGARQVRERFPSCVSVFVVPPSMEILRERLLARAQDSRDVVEQRMQQARDEIAHWQEFDYVIINDDFEEALRDLEAIVREGKPRRRDQERRRSRILAQLLESG